MGPIRTIVVSEGDNLYSIAKRETGDGNNWPRLFRANEDEIERWQAKRDARGHARRIGLKRFIPADWIFPGMTLRVP